MPPLTRAAHALSLCAALLCAGCDLLAGPGFAGAPLVTLRGEFIGNVGASGDRPDHLAFAWLNYDLQRPGVDWVSTQEVPFASAVPLTWAFHLYAPPPEALLNDNGSGTGKIAYGTLVAYRDLNGNGALDPIPRGGTGIDRVVGVSSEFVGSATSTSYEVAYVVGEPPPEPEGLRPGFNLVSHQGVLPLDTSIPITLAHKPVNNLFLCQAIAGELGPTDEDWNRCLGPGPVRTFGVLVAHPATPLFHGAFAVYSGEGQHADAEVTVNGVRLPFDPESGQHAGTGDGAPLFTLGATASVRIAVPGHPVQQWEVPVQGDFTLTSPDGGATFPKSGAVPLRWTPSAGAWRMHLRHFASVEGAPPARYSTIADRTGFDLPPFPGIDRTTGPVQARVQVSAFNRVTDDNGTDIGTWVRRSVAFTYEP